MSQVMQNNSMEEGHESVGNIKVERTHKKGHWVKERRRLRCGSPKEALNHDDLHVARLMYAACLPRPVRVSMTGYVSP
jgi:hypothetical protein